MAGFVVLIEVGESLYANNSLRSEGIEIDQISPLRIRFSRNDKQSPLPPFRKGELFLHHSCFVIPTEVEESLLMDCVKMFKRFV